MTIDEIEQSHKSHWYVLHVKPRTEKVTADWLAHYKTFYHLPMYLKVRKV